MSDNLVSTASTDLSQRIAGVTWIVSIAISLDGNQPATFFPSGSIDLSEVERFNQFFAYLQFEYMNNSGSALKGASIALQMPLQGEPNFYEPYTPSAAPAGWVSYPNTPTGDGNTEFTIDGFHFDPRDRLLTWNASKPINNGSSGIIFVKIPLRKPYTMFGTYSYEAMLHTDQGDDASSASFTINGVHDELPYEITRQTSLGFTPEAPDADQYYYHRYRYTTAYNPNYLMPPRPYEHDQAVVNAPVIDVILPAGAEVLATGSATTVTFGVVHLSAYMARNSYFVVRYPKSLYPDSDAVITLEAVAVGRYIGDSLINIPIQGTRKSFPHAVGAPTSIPEPFLGGIQIVSQPTIRYSHEGFLLGAQPISRGGYAFRRVNDTIIADEVLIKFQNVDFVEGGVSATSDYGYNMIYVEQFYWSGASDPLNPLHLTITAIFDDSTSEILASLTEAEVLSTGGFSVYGGNVPGKRMAYDPPPGKIAKEFTFSIMNCPAGMYIGGYINGFIRNYPLGGAELIRQHYTKIVYGRDVGAGRPEGDLSGEFVFERPILRDTALQPNFTVVRATGNAVNPGSLDRLRLSALFIDSGYDSFQNPVLGLLLPEGYSYESYLNTTTEYTANAVQNVYNLPDGRLLDTPPSVTSTQNYNGTGRTFVRVQYYGLLQPCEILSADITVRVSISVSIGAHVMNGYLWAENPDFESILDDTLTPVVPNLFDVMGNGDPDSHLFGRDLTIVVSRGVGTLLYTTMKGSLDPALTNMATTKQGTIIDGNITMDYNGITPMQGIQLASILPYEGDLHGSMWGPPNVGQRMTLAAPVDSSAYPGTTVYYNLTPTDDPLGPGWSTTYAPSAAAVRIDMPPNFELISGDIERLDIPLRLQMPGTGSIVDLASVLGTGVLPVKGYDATTVLPDTGLEGDTSSIVSLGLTIDVFVFHDINGNGSYDAGDSPYENVLINVYHGGGDPNVDLPLYSGLTDSEGHYALVDGFGADLDFAAYKIIVKKPLGDDVFTQGSDVTVGTDGTEIVELTASAPNASIVAGIQGTSFLLTGRYWINLQNPADGLFNPGDIPYEGAIIRLYTVTIGEYESITATTDMNGYFIFPQLPKGPVYRVDFPLTSAQYVSPIAVGGNMLTELQMGIASYTFSSGTIVGDSFHVDGAVFENGNITVLFYFGRTLVKKSEMLLRQLETTYTAFIGTVEDTTPLTYGTFTVPAGYRLLSSEPTSKTATIDYANRTAQIIFFVERIGALCRIKKIDAQSSQPLDGAIFIAENGENYVTNAEGYVVLGSIPPGSFSFRETQPPIGYEPNISHYTLLVIENPDQSVAVSLIIDGATPIPLTIDADGFYTAIIPNTQGIVDDSVSLRLYKYNAQNPVQSIEGAVFTDAGSQSSFVTDASGYAFLGTFQSVNMLLEETSAPPEYEPNENEYGIDVIFNSDQTFTVLESVNGGTPSELSLDEDGFYTIMIPNTPLAPVNTLISLKKVDANSGQGLAGARFRDQDGNIYTTDSSGNVSIGLFSVGDEVVLTEITPPFGYQRNDIVYRLVLISGDGGVMVEIYENGVLAEIIPVLDGHATLTIPNSKIRKCRSCSRCCCCCCCKKKLVQQHSSCNCQIHSRHKPRMFLPKGK